jgi:imidazolonepropionase-like amidohydrolase
MTRSGGSKPYTLRAAACAAALAAWSLTCAPAAVRAFTNATLIPVAGLAVEGGTLVIDGTKIAAVGSAGATPVPAGAEVVDCTGKTIMPGLVCTHSHIGQVEGADRSAPIQPEVRALDAIDVLDPSFKRARAGGITTANIMPGSGHLLSGQTVYVKLRDGKTIEEVAVRTADGAIAGGIKMANGTNSIRDAPFPGTRGKSAALVRQQFVKAQAYREKLARKAAADTPEEPGDKPQGPDRDLALEALVEILDGKRVVHHHTHRHDDILTVLRLKDEFGFRVVLHHVSEAWKVADQIAAAGVPCSIIYLDSPGGKLEARDIEWRNGAELEKRGVLTAIHTDDPINDSRWFLRNAALGVRAGMSREKTLEALTLAGAQMLDLGERTGSLEPGKDADFIILSGDPFSISTRVLETWVEGTRVFDLENPDDRLFAEGGFGAGQLRRPNTCCFAK